MTAYALAHLRKAPVHTEVLEYMERIQDTLDSFGGRFIVHGGTVDVLEGDWPGDVVIIAFPDMSEARSWYDSVAYQDIKPRGHDTSPARSSSSTASTPTTAHRRWLPTSGKPKDCSVATGRPFGGFPRKSRPGT